MYKPLSDSTLMRMNKKEIIGCLRIAEHNHRVCEEQNEIQYRNCIELLKKERTDAIDECIKILRDASCVEDCDEIDCADCMARQMEQLKEQK